ncbi:hypothetical protein HY570_03100 [Candidatus Micrarchaeota archaeon]|nr:hypothetical protein [Candidatus Micrarchaeota archaeon]
MRGVLGIAVFFLLLVSPVLADFGPSPERPVIEINLFKGTEKYTGTANVTYLCSQATERGEPKNAVKPGDLDLQCSQGKCTNTGWYYKFNPCFTSKGKFQVITEGRSAVTEEVSFESPGFYSLDVDVETGKINRSDNFYIPCITSFLGILLLSLFVFSRK